MSDAGNFDDIEKEFDDALRLRDAGQVDDAVKILEALAQRRPDAYPVLGTLAGIQYSQGDMEGARKNFSRTVELSPRSELASRGLFHALYRLGRLVEAFEEMARFRSLKRSSEYDSILEDLAIEVSQKLKEDANDKFLLELRDRVLAELQTRPARKGAD